MDISEQEKVVTAVVARNLLATERLMARGEHKDAKYALNVAAGWIRALDRIYKQRRGEPRRLLKVKVRYYSVWQRALAGALSSNAWIGKVLLIRALKDANELAHEQASVPNLDFDGLVRKIQGWQPTK